MQSRVEIGSTMFRAQGSAFFSDGNASYYIEEGEITAMLDGQGQRLVSLHGGRLYAPMDDRWRATRAEALRDASEAIAAHAKRMQEKADEAARKADEAEVVA